jgi:succinate dehydrogenase/fumarate reductase cytochrome b subunit
MNQTIFAIVLLGLPAVAKAASLQTLMSGTMKLISDTLVPFLISIAFLFFAINVVRYFVLGGDNKDVKEQAKSVALYSIAAFVFLLIFWGLVNMFASATGLEGKNPITPDYVK